MANDGTLKFDTRLDSGGFKKGIDSISNTAQKGFQATVSIFKGAATAIGGLGAAAIKVGSDFESGMSRVAAISGASGLELEELTEKAKYMGSTTKFSASESAAAFEYMAMAGWKTGDMLNGIEGIMNLAAASGEDLASTSDIVTDALTAFGMSAADSGHFADILAQASSNANTNVRMMGETFKYAAPVAGALGYTAEDTALAIGLMANAGIKSSQAGTSLRSVMSRLAKPTKETRMAMDALGVSLTNSDGSMKSLNEIMEDLREGFNGLSEAEAAELASSLAGQEAMSGLLAIVNASDEDFDKLERSIYNCDGAAAQMAETMQDNLQGQLIGLKSGLEGLGISLYEEIRDPCKEIVKEVREMVTQLQEAFEDGGLEGLVTAFGDILAQIVEKVAEAGPDLIDAAAGLVGSFCEALKSSTTIGDAASSLITSLITGFFSCADDIWTTAIVLAGRVAEGLAEGAPQMVQAAVRCIADIVECMYEWLPDFIDAGRRIIEGIIQGISEEFPSLGAFLSGLFEGFTSTLGPILDSVISIVQGIFGVISEADPSAMEAIGKALGTIAAAMVTMNAARSAAVAVKGVASALNSMTSGVAAVLGGAVMAVTNFFDMLQNGFSWLNEALMVVGIAIAAVGAVILGAPAAVAAVVAGIVAGIATLVVVIKDHWEQIAEFFTGIGTAIADFFAGIPDAVGGVVNTIVEFFKGLPERIGTWFTSTVERVKAWGSNMVSAAGEAAGNFIDNVITFLSELPGEIAYLLGVAVGHVIKWGVDLVSWAVTEVPKIIDKVVTFFSELPEKIWIWLTDTIDKVGQWGKDLLASAGESAKNAVDKAVEWFKKLPGNVWTWLTNTITKVGQFAVNLGAKAVAAAQGFVTKLVNGVKNLPNQMMQIGKNIVTGIWNGISSGWKWLIDGVKNLANSLLQGVKDFLGIHSPSKLFAEGIGEWIPPGIGVGIEDAMPGLERQMDDEMEDLADRMQTAVLVETGRIEFKKNAEQTYKTEMENGQSFENSPIEVNIEGEIHTQVDLDGVAVGNSTTPIVDKNMARIDSHKKRGG